MYIRNTLLQRFEAAGCQALRFQVAVYCKIDRFPWRFHFSWDRKNLKPAKPENEKGAGRNNELSPVVLFAHLNSFYTFPRWFAMRNLRPGILLTLRVTTMRMLWSWVILKENPSEATHRVLLRTRARIGIHLNARKCNRRKWLDCVRYGFSSKRN